MHDDGTDRPWWSQVSDPLNMTEAEQLEAERYALEEMVFYRERQARKRVALNLITRERPSLPASPPSAPTRSNAA